MERPAMPAKAISAHAFPGAPVTTCGAAPAPVLGSTAATGLIAGAAAVQACGTDNPPIEAARRTPADTAAGPRPAPRPAEPADPTATTGPNWLRRPIIRASAPTI
jgi:hypothetical protein